MSSLHEIFPAKLGTPYRKNFGRRTLLRFKTMRRMGILRIMVVILYFSTLITAACHGFDPRTGQIFL